MRALFIILIALLVIAILFVIFFPHFYKKYISQNYVKTYGKKIYRYALNEDFYLINQLCLEGRDETNIYIDHLLFGRKYIYIITDYYMNGEIRAKEEDRSWVYYPSKKNEKSQYIANLINVGYRKAKNLAELTALDDEYFVAIAVVNNDLDLNQFESKNDCSKIVHINKIKALIASYENRDIGELNDNQMKHTVKDIHKMNKERENNGK